jgi:hypothetical protein
VVPIPTRLFDESTFNVDVSTVRSPEIVAEVSVPTEVSDDAVTPEASVLPESLPAAAVAVIFPVPSNDTPLIVRAVAKAVAVAASVTAMLAVPSNDTPPMVRPVAKAVAVAASPVQDPDDPEALPVTLPVRGPAKAVAVAVPVTLMP